MLMAATRTMEADVSQDFQDYWNEYRVLAHEQKCSDEEQFGDVDVNDKPAEEEGLDEAEWLVLAGLSHLTDTYLQGEEIVDDDLQPVMSVLSTHQANAVRKRVHTLNQTIRHRGKIKNRKPDIRDVFKNVQIDCKTGYDSENSDFQYHDEYNTQYRSLPPEHEASIEVSIEQADMKKEHLPCFVKQRELFRGVLRPEGDIVASTNDGIEMVGFQRLGTIRGSFHLGNGNVYIPRERYTQENETQDIALCENIWDVSHVTKQGIWKESWDNSENVHVGRTWIDTLAEEDIQKLKPLFFVELSALFDQAGVPFPKTKANKRKRKHEGNIFGASLESLVAKDRTVTNDHCNVPLVFRKILAELERRGLKEQGVLRVAGQKQRVDRLCQLTEKHFYTEMQEVDQALQRSAIHDLTALLKKLLRDLPEPILTSEFVNLFYQSHYLPNRDEALNLLALLLPAVHRSTLLAILHLLQKIIDLEEINKMGMHNVAMIIAPSLLPPRFIQADKTGTDLHLQVGIAAVSCAITEQLIKSRLQLDIVPDSLVVQLREINDLEKYKLKENHQFKKILGNRKGIKGDFIVRRIDNEVDYQEGIIRVNVPQFNLSNVPVQLNKETTAGDIVLKMSEIWIKRSPQNINVKQLRRRDIKQRVLTELAPNGNLSCLLASADPDMALKTHFLYEIGGNIGQRKVEPKALVMAIYQQNPNAQWIIRCDHRHPVKHNIE